MQSDLFNLSMSNSYERQAFQRSFFEQKYTFRFDQLLGAGIAFIVFFVMVFAWGAEHGKAVSHREMVREGVVSSKAVEQTAASVTAPSVTEVITQQTAPATVNAPSSENLESNTAEAVPTADVEVPNAATVQASAKYTIAHMTYVKKDQATKEIERIKSKGYESFVVSSGKYYQLCVSGFESRQSANEAMKSLRTKGIVSSDSYIRNMPVS
ncbi:MAG TPA: SPOR domain-containing protein [Candidatus Omnitrophota bacterium]|nr:SPOR domain-containing protein [Candidatus Omnitrophota bacterium]